MKSLSFLSKQWWLVLIVLVGIGGQFYYNQHAATQDIVLRFDSAAGILPGKTPIKYRGVVVGKVQKVTVNVESDDVNITLRFSDDTNLIQHVSTSTHFWVVRPTLQIDRISGLNTLLSGNEIHFQLGETPGEPITDVLDGDERPPLEDTSTLAAQLTLLSSNSKSLEDGSPIYYLGYKIGKIRNVSLRDTTTLVRIYIFPEYRKYITPSSRFWKSSGVRINGSLSGVKVETESIASILQGGISMMHIDDNATEDFTLYDSKEHIVFSETMSFTTEDLHGLRDDSKIIFNGFIIGTVSKIETSHARTFHLTAQIRPEFKDIFTTQAHCQIQTLKMSVRDGIKNLETLLSGPSITVDTRDGDLADSCSLTTEEPKLAGKAFIVTLQDSVQLRAGTDIQLYSKKIGYVEKTTTLTDTHPFQHQAHLWIYDEYLTLFSASKIGWMSTPGEFSASFEKGVHVTLPTLDEVIAPVYIVAPLELQVDHDETLPKVLYNSYTSALADHPEILGDSREFVVHSSNDTQLQAGAAITYNGFPVGVVASREIDGLEQSFRLRLREPYATSLGKRIRFYESSGLHVSGDIFSGITADVQSATALFSPSIQIYHVPKDESYQPTTTLYHSQEEAEKADYLPIKVQLLPTQKLRMNTQLEIGGQVLGVVVKELSTEKYLIFRVHPKYAQFFTTSTTLYLKDPEISIAKIGNISKLLETPAIEVYPSTTEIAPQTTFYLSPKTQCPPAPGAKRFELYSDKTHTLRAGAKVLFRQVQVGTVHGTRLTRTGDGVIFMIDIYKEFIPLITSSSKFWVTSGLKLSGSVLSGIKVQTSTLEDILQGSISFRTPPKSSSVPLSSISRFELYTEPDEDWLEWKPQIRLPLL